MAYGKLALDAIETSGNLTVTGNVTTSGNLSVTGNVTTSGTVQSSALRSLSANTAPVFRDSAGAEIGTLCRAWVNFSAGTGVPVPRASFNVSSITDNGVGNFTINFTTAMPDVNYCTLSVANEGDSVSPRMSLFGTQTTSGVQVITRTFQGGVSAGALADFFQNHVI